MSKNRKFRARSSWQEEEGDGAGGEPTAPPPPPPPSKGEASTKASKPKKTTLLSFEDGEEDYNPVGHSKKSSKSKGSKFRREKLQEEPAAAGSGAHKPAAGEYTADRLAELKKATPLLPASKKPANNPLADGAGGSSLGILKLSGSFKPAGAPKDDRFTISAAPLAPPPAPSPPTGDNDMPLPPPPRPAGGGSRGPSPGAAGAGPAAAAGAGGGDGLGEQIGEPVSIVDSEEEEGFREPDADTIRMAKAKRERLRQAHLAPDYIPLGGASRLMAGPVAAAAAAEGKGGGAEGGGADAEAGPSGSESEDELEERMRMTFVDKPTSGAAGGAAPGKASRADAGLYSSTLGVTEDEEAFEEEQLRRAIRRNAGKQASTSKPSGAAVPGGRSVAGAYGRNRLEAITAAGKGVVKSLQEALQRAQASQKQLQGNHTRTLQNLTDALATIERIQEDIKKAGDKYLFVQEVKSYISDLCDCLASKATLVEELEDQLQEFREERAAAAAKEVKEDTTVLMHQAEAAVAAAIQVLGHGGAPAAAAAAAGSAAREAEDSALEELEGGSSNGQVEVDEFGRTVVLQRQHELREGASRRKALLAAQLELLQSLQAGGQLDLEADDYSPPSSSSTSSSSRAAVRQYLKKRSEVLEVAPTVFADAADEFGSLEAVKAKLEGWKAAYPQDYQNAYVPESAPALFAPFVRLQLLQWDPLYAGSSSSSSGSSAGAGGGTEGGADGAPGVAGGFDQQRWYSQLFEYGLVGQDPAAAAAADDPDANLVPKLVESLILPQALHLVAKCWDPFDLRQTKAIANLVSDLFVYVPADKEDMGQLLSRTTAALEGAVAAAGVPPWPAAAAAAAPLVQAVYQWRFKRAAALLRGLLGFQELLSQQLLMRLAVVGLVNGQLVPAVRSSLQDLPLAVARAEAVVLSLPSSWWPEQGTWPEGQPLVEVVGAIARALEGSRGVEGGRAGAQAAAGLARRVAALLRHVKQGHTGQRLLDAFG